MKKTKAEAYLERPYRRVLIPDSETETYTAEIAEFPGCVTEGKTPTEALRRLEAAAESWIEAALDAGQAIPEPMEEQEYSGKLVLRLSRSLHRRAAERAQAEGISLNQFIATTLAERVGTVAAKAVTISAGPFPVTLNVGSIQVLPMTNTFFVQTALPMTPTFFFPTAAVGERMALATPRDSFVSSQFAHWPETKQGALSTTVN